MKPNKAIRFAVSEIAKSKEIIIIARMLLLRKLLRKRVKNGKTNKANLQSLCSLEDSQSMSEYISNKKIKRMFKRIYSEPIHVKVSQKGLDFLYHRRGETEKVIHFTFRSLSNYIFFK